MKYFCYFLTQTVKALVTLAIFAILAQACSGGKIWKVENSKCESVEK